MSKTAKIFLKFLFGSGINIFASLLSGIIISRSIGPEGKGYIAELLVFPMLILPIADLGLRQTCIYLLGEKMNRGKVINTLFSLLFCSGILSALFILWKISLDNELENLSSFELGISLIYVPIFIAFRAIFGIFLAEGNTKIYNVYRWAPAAIKLMTVILFLFFNKVGIKEVLFATIIGETSILLFGFINIIKKQKLAFSLFDFSLAKKMLIKGSLFAISFAVIQMNHRLDIYLLKEFNVKSQNIGYYINGVGIAELLWQAPAILGLIILSKVQSTNKEEKISVVATSLRLSNSIILFGSAFVFIFCPFIIDLFYGKAFADSVPVTRNILIGVILFNPFKIINSYYESFGAPLKVLIITLPALLINVIINIILIPAYDIQGAVWATNISYFLCSFIFTIKFSLSEKVRLSSLLFLKKIEIKNYSKNILNKITHRH